MIRESVLDPRHAISREVIKAGDYWLKEIKAGQTLRILDLEGNQAADTLFYSAADPGERYSATDTIREQGNLYLTLGSQLRSNWNRVMLEIIADTCGRHDTLGGACATESNTVRYALEKRCGQLDIRAITSIFASISTYLPGADIPSANVSPPCSVTGTFIKKLMLWVISRLPIPKWGFSATASIQLSRQACMQRFSSA